MISSLVTLVVPNGNVLSKGFSVFEFAITLVIFAVIVIKNCNV